MVWRLLPRTPFFLFYFQTFGYQRLTESEFEAKLSVVYECMKSGYCSLFFTENYVFYWKFDSVFSKMLLMGFYEVLFDSFFEICDCLFIAHFNASFEVFYSNVFEAYFMHKCCNLVGEWRKPFWFGP
jgi:hypothetical protein